MARIRSLHPEQFTDDDFVTCSPLARLLSLGVRNQADDNGIFEWNAVKLKMRVLPADNCEVPALLDELAASRQVLRFTVSGKEYGIIRNFQTFQRPKYPTFQHPTPPGKLPKGYALSERYSGKLTPDSDGDSGNADAVKPKHSPIPPEVLPQTSGKRAAEESSGEESRKHPELKRSASSGASPPEPAVAALRVLIEADPRITLPAKGRMHLGQWATEGVTPEQLTAAIRIARTRKPQPELIPFAYLVPIVGDVRAGKAIDPEEPRGRDAIPDGLARIRAREAREAEARGAATPEPSTRARAPEPEPEHFEDAGQQLEMDDARWWESPEAVMARAVELNVTVMDGQAFDDFTARVMAAEPGEYLDQLPNEMREKVDYFAAVGVNSEAARHAPS